MYSPLRIWVVSRVFVVGSACLASAFLSHHDLSDALLADKGAFSFLVRWDAVHFYTIGREGYKTDSLTAFFPLLPFLARSAAVLGLSLSTSAFLLSNLLFLISAIYLHRITEKYLGGKIAARSSFLFCFNPCSILYSSFYSESLFCFCTTLGVYCLLADLHWASAALLSTASAARSNGFLLAPVLLVRALSKPSSRSKARSSPSFRCLLLLSFSPVLVFLSVQTYWWWNRFSYLKCSLPYSYVQSRYWEQGFLRFYFYRKNIPNIALGAPFVLLSALVFLNYYKRERKTIFILKRKSCFESLVLFLHLLHLFQVLLSVFFIHMNMHFRFISYNPVVYWEVARMGWGRRFSGLLLFGWVAFGLAYSVLYGGYFPPA